MISSFRTRGLPSVTRLSHSWVSIAQYSKSAFAVAVDWVVKSGRISPSLRVILGTQSLEIGWCAEIGTLPGSAIFSQ